MIVATWTTRTRGPRRERRRRHRQGGTGFATLGCRRRGSAVCDWIRLDPKCMNAGVAVIVVAVLGPLLTVLSTLVLTRQIPQSLIRAGYLRRVPFPEHT